MHDSPVTLQPIGRDGLVPSASGSLPDAFVEALAATNAHYATSGFVEPWISYAIVVAGAPAGLCAFKGAPRDRRVEIAYYVLPGFEGKGVATAAAAALVALARRADPELIVAAQTLPERNASHRVLEKNGFRAVATLEHPEDGTVLEWHWIG